MPPPLSKDDVVIALLKEIRDLLKEIARIFSNFAVSRPE